MLVCVMNFFQYNTKFSRSFDTKKITPLIFGVGNCTLDSYT